jgi:hypothetical protein
MKSFRKDAEIQASNAPSVCFGGLPEAEAGNNRTSHHLTIAQKRFGPAKGKGSLR